MPSVEINEGALPALSVNSPASFQPTVTGTETFTVQYENDDGGADTQELTLAIDDLEDDHVQVQAAAGALGLTTYPATVISGEASDWLIDPSAAGLTRMAYADGSEESLGTVANGEFVGAANGWRWGERNGSLEIVADAGATGGRVLRQVYPIGFPGTGTEPGTLYDGSATLSYVRIKGFRLSANWVNAPANVNKIIFIGIGDGPGTNSLVFQAKRVSTSPDLYMIRCVPIEQDGAAVVWDANLDPTGSTFAPGEAVDLEFFADRVRNAAGIAVNAVQIMDRLNGDGYTHNASDPLGTPDQTINLYSSDFVQNEWAPTHGGTGGDPLEVEIYQEVDSIEFWTGSGNELNAFLQGAS